MGLIKNTLWRCCLLILSLLSNLSVGAEIVPIQYRTDDTGSRQVKARTPGSHIKIFLPSLPYLAITHSINGTLVKPSDTERGWEFELATAMRRINDTVYEFDLRKGVRFQDGGPFDADSVVMNLKYFKEKPFTYSKIDKVFSHVEKINQHKIRIHLTEKYGALINDLINLPLYTPKYLRKFGWNGKSTAANLAEAGPYGLGPFILESGYVEGDRHTAQATLRANPYYWNRQYPKVDKITVFTELDSKKAKDSVLYKEGELDIAVIYPEDKVETVLGPYSKLLTSASTDNIAIHFNMITPGNPKLKETRVRRALNEALNQEMLLRYAFDGEGVFSVATASPEFPGVREVAKEFESYSTHNPYLPEVQERLAGVLKGERFSVLTQQRFLPLWRGIETQLAKVGVSLDLDVRLSETEIFEQLLATGQGKNTKKWDFLVWGEDDWFYNHPWTAFFVFRASDKWSTIQNDPVMNSNIDAMFRTEVNDPAFVGITRAIIKRAYEQGYMLFVPTPNKVFALNKEVVFTPYKYASIPLWKIAVTKQHWSVRKGPYPEERKTPIQIARVNFQKKRTP